MLDTSVASFLFPAKRNEALKKDYEEKIGTRLRAICFQTVAELLLWAEKRNFGDRQQEELIRYIEGFILLPFDWRLNSEWARLMAFADRTGQPLRAGDAWIAASAILNDIPLITHDRDFSRLAYPGLETIACLPT